MKTVEMHEAEAVVAPGGTVHVDGLPFSAGDRVRVMIVRESEPHGSRRYSAADIARSLELRTGGGGRAVKYDRPDEPVGVDDWEVMGDSPGGK